MFAWIVVTIAAPVVAFGSANGPRASRHMIVPATTIAAAAIAIDSVASSVSCARAMLT